MRWKLKTPQDEALHVELLSTENNRFKFKVGDEIVELSDPKVFPFSIEANGRSVSLETWNSQKWRAAFGDKIVTVAPLSMGKSSEASKNEIRTQMPGRVLKVLVTPGQKIQAKQTLLIIEAMKMENEIRSESDATIQSIEVTPGQNVESGNLLIKLAI